MAFVRCYVVNWSALSVKLIKLLATTNLEQLCQRKGKCVQDQFDLQPKFIRFELMTVP